MAFVTTTGGDVCQQPGPPDGTQIPAGDLCRGEEVRALPESMWLVGLDDASNGPNDDDFWDVFFRLTFGPDRDGWLDLRYEYLGGETIHDLEVKVEEQWVEPLREGEVELNPVRMGDVVRIMVKDRVDHSVGRSPDPGVIWAAQVQPQAVPEPQTWGLVVVGMLIVGLGRLKRRFS